MTNSEKKNADQNIDLLFDFVRYLIENPDEMDKIPKGSAVRFRNYNHALYSFPASDDESTFWVDIKQDFKLNALSA
ncbi:MAG: hypothetical protein AAF849_00980 [Bacteroidota bacterium]